MPQTCSQILLMGLKLCIMPVPICIAFSPSFRPPPGMGPGVCDDPSGPAGADATASSGDLAACKHSIAWCKCHACPVLRLTGCSFACQGLAGPLDGVMDEQPIWQGGCPT
jgi:hypothetical protein